MTKKNKVKDSKLEEESIQKLSGVEDAIKEADKKIIISEIDKLKEELAVAEDAKLRALAEVENMRRRMEKEKQENARYGSSNLARGLFTILDNFDRALLASPKEPKNKKDIEKNYLSLHEGVELTLKDISALFRQNGIEIIIPSKGDSFDHNIHQAMLEVPTDELKSGCVCEVLQAGYKIYDRLLRPAMVGVSKELVKEK
ncbi:MAG TPA: nucleotide exchange factor GrpE [Alphaproteobacteria bacterium]|jgi:molecular chaperone GrpE|nr:nucleotide exchange factor GrpE [Alphaproteobacteria bacterium]|tara:strand:+ start:40 stop:639 length:600 start_codon:yes stop_codon:yes gene_type:complete